MSVPYITSFFWCMSLQRGTKLISIMHLTWSVAVVVICAVMAEEARDYMGTVEDAGDHLYTTCFIITTVIAAVSAVHVMLASTLMYAAFTRNPCALRVWVWVMVALWAAALLAVLAAPVAYGFSASGSDIFLYFLEGLLLFGFVGYCILCVYSFSLMLQSAEDMEGPAKTNY